MSDEFVLQHPDTEGIKVVVVDNEIVAATDAPCMTPDEYLVTDTWSSGEKDPFSE